MKKSLLSLFVIGGSALLFADDYEIIKMNMPSVKIGNYTYKKGETFAYQNDIIWAKETDALKARNINTGEIRVFTAAEFKKYQSKSIKEYFIKRGKMSSRFMGLGDLAETLNDTFYLVDTLSIQSPILLNEKRYYYISYTIKGKPTTVKLISTNDEAIIVRDMLKKLPVDKDIKLSIYIKDEEINDEMLLADSMIIRLLPRFIE